MGLFDTFLDQVTGAGGEVSGEGGGGFLDNLGGLFGGNDNEGEGGGGGGFLDNLGGLFGGNDNEGDSEGGGGFLDNLGGLFGGNDNEGDSEGGGGFLDNLGGLFGGNDNEGEGGRFVDNLVDRVSSALPEELRDVAGTFLGNDDATATRAAPNAPASQPADYDDVGNTGIVPPHLNGSENVADSTMAFPEDTYRTEVMPDDPTFPDDATFGNDGLPASVSAPVLLDDPVEVAPEPMDDFEQTIQEADQIEDSFDAMLQDLG